MPNTLIKVGAGIIGISSVTTGSYFIRGYYNKERIIHRMSNTGMTLLTRGDKEEEGAKRGKDYIDNNKNANIGNLKDYEHSKADPKKIPKEFKDKCLSSLSLAIEGNESLSSQIEKYCTKSFKVSELLKGEKGVKLLEQTDSDDLGKNAWGKYVDENKKSENPLSINGWKVNTQNNKQILPNNYKGQCNSFQGQEIKSKRDEKYSIVKSWCTRV